MGALKKYDLREVTVTWDGLSLASGVSAGEFITFARNEPTGSLNTGADGKSTMVVNPNRTAAASLNLRAGSDTNDLLADVVASDESGNGSKRVGVFQVKDFSGKSLLISEETFLAGPPDVGYGDEEADNAWNFVCADSTMDVRGSNQAAPVPGTPSV